MSLYKSVQGFEIFNVLRFSNLFIYLLVNVFYLINGLTSTVDIFTLILYLILTIQINIFLLRERYNPFITLLAFFLIFFHCTRILTIYWNSEFSSSEVLQRLGQATALDLNYAILYMIAANTMLYYGLRGVNQIKSPITFDKSQEIGKYKILGFLITTIVYIYSLAFFEIPFISPVLNLLLSINGILLVSFATLFYVKSNGSYKKIIILTLITYAALRFLSGSRSILLVYIQFIMVTSLASGKHYLSKKLILFIICLIIFSVITFPIITYLRQFAGGDYQNINYIDYIYLAFDYFINSEYDIRALIPVFDRSGFLDFTVDSIKNTDSYSFVVNLPWELMSVIDGLTPGFDIFDKPLIANAIIGLYSGIPEFFTRINGGGYQSDQFNFYGEIFILFGPVISLPIVYIFGLVFKKIYIIQANKNDFNSFVWRSFILYLFIVFINSFGLDWAIVYSLPMLLYIIIILSCINKKIRVE